MLHYLTTGEERKIKLLSTASLGDAPLCGATGRQDAVREVDHVDCSGCLEILAEPPAYLHAPRKAGEPQAAADWCLHALVREGALLADSKEPDRTVLAIWTDGKVWQSTHGLIPEGTAGYASLDDVLAVKDIDESMLEVHGGTPTPR